MTDTLKKYSFRDLLQREGRVRIPKIQRDYAQGRQDPRVAEIRKAFVRSLMLVVKGKRQAIELDFVYGSQVRDAFEPLDGQQRLTTLFLLHWMMDVDYLRSADGRHSVFTYETRATSNEFCNELVHHHAPALVAEAAGKAKKLSRVIRERDWFKWEWRYDPTILSMLVMLDAINDEMSADWSGDLDEFRGNLNHITFNLLNLGDFGLSNELFVKMNARGKQLSDFDKLKSTLEEELQLQQAEHNERGGALASATDEADWRLLMDGVWIDLFWHKYPQRPKMAELQLKKLLLRLIALQLFENDNISESLLRAAYAIDEADLDNLLYVYAESLTDLRKDDTHVIPASQPRIDFRRLIDDVNLLICKGREISSLLPHLSHVNADDATLLDTFLGKTVANDAELIFYAMLLFLRRFQPQTASAAWFKNLECWVRSMRNVLLNDNNNQRIDKLRYAVEAARSLREIADEFADFVEANTLDMAADATVVRQFFRQLNKTYNRLDNQSLDEERQKATLLLDDENWSEVIDAAEADPYLWGQVRCLLGWAAGDVGKFADYTARLTQLLAYLATRDGRAVYTAIVLARHDCWTDNNRLYLPNKDRDNSFKRHLRDKSDDVYGINLKTLIDTWIGEYNGKDAPAFIAAFIADKTLVAPAWIRPFIQKPEIWDEAWNKRIYLQQDHVIIAQRKTSESHCFDPILLYLGGLLPGSKFYDSKGDYVHALEFEHGGSKYLIRWADTPGAYSIARDGGAPALKQPAKLMEWAESL
jgi:hypothetical protein